MEVDLIYDRLLLDILVCGKMILYNNKDIKLVVFDLFVIGS